MNEVWKYKIVGLKCEIAMPKSAKVLSVQTQNCEPHIWALVDPNEETKERVFYVFGTGFPCPRPASEYVGTFQLNDGDFVLHLFEEGRSV